MKTIKAPYILILLVFCTSFCMVNGQPSGNYYYYKNKKIELPLNKERILLYYQNNPDTEKHLETEYGMTKVQDRCVSSEQKDVLCGEFQLKNAQDYFTILERLHSDQNIIDIERVFGSENPVSISNQFYVNLHNPEDYELLKRMADANNVQIIERFGLDNWYILKTTVASSSDALDCCNLFYESGLFKDVDPGFIMKIVPSANVTDSSFGQQWAIDGLGVDIHAKEAWDYTKGKSSIKVAILDGRIDETHNEFIGTNFMTPYDADANSNNISCYYSSHGTGVASIMAANHNSYEVAGVAPLLTYLNIIIPNGVTDAAVCARAISYAFHNGADVINNSWSFGYNGLPANNTLMENTIDSALYMGRNGKGCVIVFASGNENNGSLPYPANYNPDLLVVGAVGIDGKRVSISTGNGSNYGQGLDVMAPGYNIYMASADYFYPSNIYGSTYQTGWGTSFAAPHVSAIAGLILSAVPDLTREKVVDYIEQSCDTTNINAVDTITANGPWEARYGYGLVDAYKSLVKEVNDSIVDADIQANIYSVDGCFVKMNNYNDLNHSDHEIVVKSFVATEIRGLFSLSDSYMYINAIPSP